MLESKGERVFESGEDSLCEMVCRVGKLIEVEAFHVKVTKPWYVKESEWKRGCGK